MTVTRHSSQETAQPCSQASHSTHPVHLGWLKGCGDVRPEQLLQVRTQHLRSGTTWEVAQCWHMVWELQGVQQACAALTLALSGAPPRSLPTSFLK